MWTGQKGEEWSAVPGCFCLDYDELTLPDEPIDYSAMQSDDIDKLVDDKRYLNMCTDFSCIRDGRARYTTRKDGILDYIADWDTFVHFGRVPNRKELIRVVGIKRLAELARADQFPSTLVCRTVPCPDIVQPPETDPHIESGDNEIYVGPIDPKQVAYILIEFCCEPDSRLCDTKYSTFNGKTVILIRLTEAVDMETVGGMCNVLNAIVPFIEHTPIFLWGSLPCTLGSTFQHINKLKSKKWEERKSFLSDQFDRLFSSFMDLAYVVHHSMMGEIIFEWPTGCALWKDERVVGMISKYSMIKQNINGCMLGLTSIEGRPMKKPWTLYSTMDEIQKVFANDLCDGSHEHQTIQGKNTARTSSYPWGMTDKVHEAIRMRVNSHVESLDQTQRCGKGEESVACPSVVSASIFDVDSKWIFDTGCAQDLVQEDKVGFLRDQFCVAKLRRFDTANGVFKASDAVHLDYDMCGEVFSAMPYVMASTPSVISVGKKVMQEDYCSIWIKERTRVSSIQVVLLWF